jgi:hypothetical protein
MNHSCFFKIEDNGTTPLLIFFLEALKLVAFGLPHKPQVAGWLWTKPQAEQPKTFDLLLKH